jgi:hypothetical protein
VASVAEVICGVSIDSMLAKSSRDVEGASTASGTDLIWNTLLSMSAESARPIPSNKLPSSVPLAVLGNLLDCAVHVADKHQRRSFIGRIMTLPKASQKAIMAMIEMRTKTGDPTSATRSPSSVKRPKSPLKSPPTAPAQNSGASPYQTTGIQQSRRSSSSNKASAHDALSRMNCTGVGTSTSLAATVMRNNATSVSSPEVTTATTPTSAIKSSLRKSGEAVQRGVHSVAFGTPVASMASAFSPAQSDSNTYASDIMSPAFLSPGTAESPTRMQALVQNLQRKNDAIQHTLEEFKAREEALKQKFEAAETEQRQNMIRVEAESLDRIQEMQHEIDKRTADWNAHLAELQEKVRKGEAAQQELLVAKEELEVMHHNKTALVETTEKLRKYRDKVNELNDVKEALAKEREAHGQAVDDLVRLENEVQSLQPLKRQVEDYKIRALNAEVQLVESQDILRRMERQTKDDNVKHEHLFKGVLMQKEQMDELQRRIQESTEHVSSNFTVCGVGDTMTELNPALKDELVRLRNENIRLRAFQAKRNEDAVQYLEESLEDAKRLADRYKNEFLNTKESLERTQSSLTEAQDHADQLRGQVQQWQDRHRSAETLCGDFERQLAQCSEQLDKALSALGDEEDRTASLRKQVHEWKQEKQESDAVSADRLHQLDESREQLAQTQELLQVSELTVDKLRDEINGLAYQVTEHSQSLLERESVIQKLRWETENTSNQLAEKRSAIEHLENQVGTLQRQIEVLDEKLSTERSQRQEDAREAQQSLDTTRELLERKNKKEQEELQANMTRLLDDERKANRIKDERAAETIQKLEHDWNAKYIELQERSASTLKLSRQEAQDRIEYMRKEHEDDLAQLKQTSQEAQDNMVRKGKKLMEVAKAEAKKALQELHDECRELHGKNARLQSAMEEMDRLHQAKVTSFKSLLDKSTTQIDCLQQQIDESSDKIKKLDREKGKLSDENEQYRRQLSGRFGVDGVVHTQLEKLQKEYAIVVQENREYKKQIQKSSSTNVLGTIVEYDETNSTGAYRRGGGLDQQMLMQIRNDYETQLKELTDEKRDLIMKVSSHSTDVHKAEQRVWEHEEELTKLKAENTWLKLQLQRAELASEGENRSPLDSSFHSARQTLQSENSRSHNSPGIDRAKKQKLAQENMLRSRVSSITGTPPRKVQEIAAAFEASSTPTGPLSSGMALVPLHEKKKEHPNFDKSAPGTEVPAIPVRPPSPVKSSTPASKMASDVFRLGQPPTDTQPAPRVLGNAATEPQDGPSEMQLPPLDQSRDENQQECNPS